MARSKFVAAFGLTLLFTSSAVGQVARPSWRGVAAEAEVALREGDFSGAQTLYRRALERARLEGVSTAERSRLFVGLSMADRCGQGATEAPCSDEEVRAALDTARTPEEPPAEAAELAAVVEPSSDPGASEPAATETEASEFDADAAPAPDLMPEAIVEVEDPLEPIEAVEEEPPPPPTFFIEAAVSVGAGWVGEGLPADTRRPNDAVEGNSPWENCNARGESCEVRVDSPGFAELFSLRVAGGLRVAGPFSLGLAVRVQPAAGSGLLAGWLPELFGRYEASVGPLVLGAGLAVGFGQVQARPPQDEGRGPFVRSGLGWASLEGSASYVFEDNVELFLSLTPRVSFPEVLPVVDLSLGLRIRG
ncbi:MAG: hypothetical protein AAF411_00705 [Myxococcota bacterium]